jgi:hypothetical protein
VGESVGNNVFSNLKSQVDLEKIFTPISESHGHHGAQKSPFSVCWSGDALSGRIRDCPDDEK